MSVGFRPTEEDLRVIEANRREDEKTSDVIRRALRLLDREAWEERARADMHRLRSEDLSAEADEWEYDEWRRLSRDLARNAGLAMPRYPGRETWLRMYRSWDAFAAAAKRRLAGEPDDPFLDAELAA